MNPQGFHVNVFAKQENIQNNNIDLQKRMYLNGQICR